MVFHVLNRGVGRRVLFTKDEDFLVFAPDLVAVTFSPAPFLRVTIRPARYFLAAYPGSSWILPAQAVSRLLPKLLQRNT